MDIGIKIAYLRKSQQMTQSDLGNALNVTFQAVSKWERGESYPDFETLSKISKLFNVPITFFEDSELSSSEAPAPAHTPSTEPFAPAYAPNAEPYSPPAMLGMCTVCGKVIYEGGEGETYPALVCADCVIRRAEQKINAEKEKKRQAKLSKQIEKDKRKRRRNAGLITAGSICGLLLLLAIIGYISDPKDLGQLIGGYCLVTVFLFTFIAQLFWSGVIVDVCLCGGKIIGGPGVIFTLDLDGIIFLIVFKLIFWLIKVLFFLLTLVFFVALAIIFSPFTFIPATVRMSR